VTRLEGLRRRVKQLGARLTLRWRLALASFGLLALLLVGLGLLVTLTQEQTLLQNQAVTLHDEVRQAFPPLPGGGSARGGPGDNSDNIGLLISDHAVAPATGEPSAAFAVAAATQTRRLSGPDLLATIIGTDGTVLAQASDNLDVHPAVVTPSASAIQDALQKPPSPTSYSLAQDATGQRQLIVLIPMIENNQTVALLQLNTPTTQIDRSVATTRLIILGGTIVALLLAFLLAQPLIAAALRPLVEMEGTTRRVAAGELSLRLPEPQTEDEIGRLARSFNQMVAQLEAAFARQQRFVADVSHELRTPLTALGGGIEMLMIGADQGDAMARRRLMRGLYTETERLRRLVTDLLTLARLDEGRSGLRQAAVEVAPLLDDVVEHARQLASGQEITSETQPGLPLIRADADHLRQVLFNLVENAIKFTPEPGRITLAAHADADELARGVVGIEVHDTGVGISEEALPHVFERFYRGDPARARTQGQPGGSGLGLSIAQGLIEVQGGDIGITSAPGAGTTVSIQLPIWRPERDATTAAPDGVHSDKEADLASAGQP
jgi:two-component system OmpR family sensor kinase